MHMHTHNSVQMHITQCQFSTVGLFVHYCTIHCTILVESKSINPVPTYFIQALYFVFNRKRITCIFEKPVAFKLLVRAPRSSWLPSCSFSWGTRRTSGYHRLNPTVFSASFLPFGSVLLYRCHYFELKNSKACSTPLLKKTKKKKAIVHLYTSEIGKKCKRKPNKAQRMGFLLLQKTVS